MATVVAHTMRATNSIAATKVIATTKIGPSSGTKSAAGVKPNVSTFIITLKSTKSSANGAQIAFFGPKRHRRRDKDGIDD